MTSRRRVRIAGLAVSLVVALNACGLPDEGRSRTVDDRSVPYGLLDPEAAIAQSSSPTVAEPLPRGTPVVFWLRQDGRLTTAAVAGRCQDAPEHVVAAVLAALSSGPTSQQRGTGLSSALPPSAGLELVRLEGGVALVSVEPVALGDPERLPLAVGQLVLSVTSAPFVDAVEVVVSGKGVQVPVADGAVVDRPVTGDDYAQLLMPALAPDAGTPSGQSAALGCLDEEP